MEYHGLTSVQAELKLKEEGPNEISVKKPSFLIKFLKWFASPISLMLLAAAILSAIIQKWVDFYIILVLILINFLITAFHEKKADNAIEKLQKKLVVSSKVLRDGVWKVIESRYLVTGDIIEIKIGNLIPADLEVVEESNLSLNEASITGESLPVEKTINNKIYSGSFVSTGKGIGKVVATGKNTNFGKTITLLETGHKQSTMEKDIINISKFLSALSLLGVLILSLTFILRHQANAELLILDLSLIIAGIPIALPTVMALITTIGVLTLAEKDVIIRRISSLEDLANVNMLLTDKTGTLTKNEIEVAYTFSYNPKKEKDILLYASIAAKADDADTINHSIIKKKRRIEVRA